jgi:hypothetical protein
MKKLLIKFLLFLLLIWVYDLVIGTMIEKLYFSIETGTSGAMINHLTKNKYDVYIMGASAAQHGYIPEIIEKEIGMSVYNAGEDATSIFYKYAILQLILTHHKPKVIIWDMLDVDYFHEPKFDKTNLLLPYRDNPDIFKLLTDIDPLSHAVKLSHIYPYNQKIAAIASEYFRKGSPEVTNRGYLPIIGSIDLSKIGDYSDFVEINLKAIKLRESRVTPGDLLLREYLYKFIELCHTNNIELIAFTSPRCPANMEMASTPLISKIYVEELSRHGIRINYILPSTYTELYRSGLFKDLGHLNHSGAQIFSKIVAAKVKKHLAENL